jgi:hypothetical protein
MGQAAAFVVSSDSVVLKLAPGSSEPTAEEHAAATKIQAAFKGKLFVFCVLFHSRM